jgi:hypothetical protein
MLHQRSSSHWVQWLAVASVIGGLLWIPYGLFEMLEPWGTDTVYRDDRGYSEVVDSLNYVVYSLPGSLGLLLTTLGVVGVIAHLRLPAHRSGRVGRALTYVALLLAILSLLGVIVLFDPLFTTARIFGSLALGGATLLLSFDARALGIAPNWTVMLLVLGLMGLFLLPLWPLVFAVELVPEVVGAAFMMLFGLGWVLLGFRLHQETEQSQLAG